MSLNSQAKNKTALSGGAHDGEASSMPLSGVRVLDLTLARAGPTCVRHLGDWGADVIRIEAPPAPNEEDIVGNRDGFDFQNLHRDKRCVRIDLKSDEGKKIFYKLVETADIIVENMRASVKYRLGVDYETVSKINPRIIYGSISGFGQDGPYGKRAGVDQIAQGMSGLMSITGLPGGGPVRAGIPIADLTAGNLLALGITMSLFDRVKTGKGRWVHTSLLEAMLFMLDFQAVRWLIAGEVAPQAGNDHPTSIPTGVFPAADGSITLAASSPRQWTRFCELLDKKDWIDKKEWNSREGRSEHRAAINAAIGEVTRHKPREHWIDLFDTGGIPCGAINDISETFADPQVVHLDMVKTVNHHRVGVQKIVGSAINITGVKDRPRTAAPDGGVHTDEILATLGYTPDAIAKLRAAGVV